MNIDSFQSFFGILNNSGRRIEFALVRSMFLCTPYIRGYIRRYTTV